MNQINQRKLDHLQIVGSGMAESQQSPWEKIQLPYNSLPEINLDDVDTSVNFFGKNLSFPLLISSMTGGPEQGTNINKNLAEAAEETGVALALGSMRVCLEEPERLASFQVRSYCPNIPLFANLGLVQLNYGVNADDINRLMDNIDADGIFLHCNALQEALQPEGDTNFEGLVERLAQLNKSIERPILIKEVGAGMDLDSIQALYDIGIRQIDVSGTGGTSWAAVEGARRDDDLGDVFKDFGISTVDALENIKNSRASLAELEVIAGGGLRSGLDLAKARYLGAKIGSAAKPFLAAASESSERCVETLKTWKTAYKIALFCSK